MATAQLDLADPVLVVGLAGEGAASLAARLADRPEPADTSSPSPCEITRHDAVANGVVYLALSTTPVSYTHLTLPTKRIV